MKKENNNKSIYVIRILIEVSFIIFLFYANLLMGEYTHSGLGTRQGLIEALKDMFTVTNFIIAVVTAISGHLIFDVLRNKL